MDNVFCVNGHKFIPFDSVRIICERCGLYLKENYSEGPNVPDVSKITLYKRGPYKKTKTSKSKKKVSRQEETEVISSDDYQVINPVDITLPEELEDYLLEEKEEEPITIGGLEAASVRAFRNALNPNKNSGGFDNTDLGEAGEW